MRHILLPLGSLLCLAAAPADNNADRVARVLAKTPLIDGHNDWPEALDGKDGEARWTMDLTRLDPVKYHTDIERLKRGKLGAQFWSVWVSPALPGPEQVKRTLEQIDMVHHFVEKYPETFAMAKTAADVRRIHKSGRIASMIGVEGGGQIDSSLAVLREYRRLGASYLTLTHSLTTDWADSATDNPKHDGLSSFGEAVVREMNRLGMLVDISHVSEQTMLDTLRVTSAPVIFSHSGARALCDTPRNVSDTVLREVKKNGGVVMVSFVPQYVSEKRRRWDAARAGQIASYNAPPYGGLYIGQPERATKALADWEAANPMPKVTLGEVADHIDYIAKVAGVDHVGIGSDFDGVPDLPEGLAGVQDYPALFQELARRGWNDTDLGKLAGGNLLRVMEDVERKAAVK